MRPVRYITVLQCDVAPFRGRWRYNMRKDIRYPLLVTWEDGTREVYMSIPKFYDKIDPRDSNGKRQHASSWLPFYLRGVTKGVPDLFIEYGIKEIEWCKSEELVDQLCVIDHIERR